MRKTILFLFASLAMADQEEKLVKDVEKAQRAVQRANKKSEDAGAKAVAYCKSKGMTFQVKPNGLMGCVKPTK